MNAPTYGMGNTAIFEDLQKKIDEDVQVRDQLREILQVLDRQGRIAQAVLARAHSTPSPQLPSIVNEAKKSIDEQRETISKLAEVASGYPYYKYNDTWTRGIQNTCFNILLVGWLGRPSSNGEESQQGKLYTIEELGGFLGIPVNLKETDAFHLTIEEYLHSLISLIDELARLAVNSVTLGDYERPVQIAQFIKDVHAGFRILNLKNDSLRRRSDSIKYSVKKVEDVVYDLSLRNLIPKR